MVMLYFQGRGVIQVVNQHHVLITRCGGVVITARRECTKGTAEYCFLSYRIVIFLICIVSCGIAYRIASLSYHTLSYLIISYLFVLYRIVSYHFVLYHIVPYRILSYRIVSYGMVSYHIVSRRMVSYGIAWYRMVSSRTIWYRIASYLTYHTL